MKKAPQKKKIAPVTEKVPEKWPQVEQGIKEPNPCNCSMCRMFDIREDDDPAVVLTKQIGYDFSEMDDALLKRSYDFIGRYFANVSSAAMKLFLESWAEFNDDTLWIELVIFEGEVFFAQVRSSEKGEYFTGGGSTPLEAVMSAIAISQVSPKRP